MQPPEELIPLGLSYNRFRSAYAVQRRGAKPAEVSEAWERYKRHSRQGMGQESSPLCTLPPELVRTLPTYRRSVLCSLRRTCRRLNHLLSTGMERIYASPITRSELVGYLLHRIRTLFTPETCRLVLLRLVLLHDEVVSHHSWTLVHPEDRAEGTTETGHSWDSMTLFLDGEAVRSNGDLEVDDLEEPERVIQRVMRVLSRYVNPDDTLSGVVVLSETDMVRVLDRRHHPNRDYASAYARRVGLSLIRGVCDVPEEDWEEVVGARILNTLRTNLRGVIQLTAVAAWMWDQVNTVGLFPGRPFEREAVVWRLRGEGVFERKVLVEEALNEWLWPPPRRRGQRGRRGGRVDTDRIMINPVKVALFKAMHERMAAAFARAREERAARGESGDVGVGGVDGEEDE